jgi:hemerythrin
MVQIAVRWDPSLETGYAEVDAQHRELFTRIDRLLEASRARADHAEVQQLLEFLGDYVVEHFASEEGLMVLSGYPDLVAHQGEHRRFVQEFEVLYHEFRSEGPTSRFVIRIGNRVTAWLREHICRTDQQMAEWLRGHAG